MFFVWPSSIVESIVSASTAVYIQTHNNAQFILHCRKILYTDNHLKLAVEVSISLPRRERRDLFIICLVLSFMSSRFESKPISDRNIPEIRGISYLDPMLSSHELLSSDLRYLGHDRLSCGLSPLSTIRCLCSRVLYPRKGVLSAIISHNKTLNENTSAPRLYG